MKFKIKYPSKTSQPYIKNMWLMEILEEDLPFSQLYFPYGSFELICYLKNRGLMQYVGDKNAFHQPGLFYSGQFTKPFTLSFDKPCKCLGVSLNAWAGNILYKIPANHFTDNMIELADLDKSDDLILQNFLNETDERVFAALENYILQKVKSVDIDPISTFIARAIMKSPVRSEVNLVFSEIGLSKRRIEQRFLSAAGLSIGAFTRKIRFQKAVSLLTDNISQLNLTQIGYETGYFDQSHFISEFKTFSGIPPLAFSKQHSELKQFISSLVIS